MLVTTIFHNSPLAYTRKKSEIQKTVCWTAGELLAVDEAIVFSLSLSMEIRGATSSFPRQDMEEVIKSIRGWWCLKEGTTSHNLVVYVLYCSIALWSILEQRVETSLPWGLEICEFE